MPKMINKQGERKLRFSIVIPLYNKEHSIQKTLFSVQSQTFQDYEIIIVNDGSTDQSMNKVKEYLERNPEWKWKINLAEQKNQGVSAARNKGIEHARGEYISFLDADDAWYPFYLETVNDLIDRYPLAGFYVTAYRILLPGGGKVFSTRLQPKIGCLESYWKTYTLGRYDFVWTSVTTMKRDELLEIGGFRVGEQLGQDLDLWARAARINSTVAYSSRVCADYDRNAEQNARLRVPIAYPAALMIDLQQELKRNHTEAEQRAIQSKYDRKMTVFLFTSIMNGEKERSRKQLEQWQITNWKTGIVRTLLFLASFLPEKMLRTVYQLRLKWY